MDTTSGNHGSTTSEATIHPSPSLEMLLASRSLQSLGRTIAKAATSDVPVLIIGESGTGKELASRAIHEMSNRAGLPLVCVNLAAIPVELAETVLFGHEKGAFTGASHAAPGFCRRADHSTLFLDEIGEADLLLQSKLLRFLQNKEIQPVGCHRVVEVDARVIAATNRDLLSLVREKLFREDLFYRLSIVQIRLPPLRDRLDDIKALSDCFLSEFNLKYGRSCELSDVLLARFQGGHWPGNVRQLRSIIESLVLMCDREILGLQDLSPYLNSQIGIRVTHEAEMPRIDELSTLDRMTFDLVQSVLSQSNGHIPTAAKKLGLSRSTLYRWIKQYRASTEFRKNHDSNDASNSQGRGIS